MMAEALRTGGRDADKGLWMLQVLATTFCHNGREVAHRISKGHKGYTPAETDEMFDRKEEEQDSRNLGWPACKTFEGFGSKQCALCPHKDKIKSPLNLALPATPPDQKNVVGQAQDNPIIYYHPGNEAVCRTALDKIVAADPSTFTSGESSSSYAWTRISPAWKDGAVIYRVPPWRSPRHYRTRGKLAWMTRTGGSGQSWNRGKPQRDFCTDLHHPTARPLSAPPLVGIARVPHMRDDGSVRTEIGYDPQTGIFVDRAPKWPSQSHPLMTQGLPYNEY